MNLVSRYVKKENFENYDDFSKNFKLNIPTNFNFGYDVVDEYARLCPEKQAIVWTNDKGEVIKVNFGELKTITDRTANLLASHGISKGDFVMVMLRSHIEYWYIAVAMHKLGAVLVPATHLLMEKDIEYRVNSASVKMIISTENEENCQNILKVKHKCPCLEKIVCLTEKEGFINFREELKTASSTFKKRTNIKATDDLLMYFTSGTTGYPKMVIHNHTYPLAHIVTAKYWQNVVDDGLHFTHADTGWAKSSWGKIYGQWIAGAGIFIYDYDGKFTPLDLLPLFEKFQITTFCAPPTMYRFLIKEDLSKYNFSSIKYFATAGEPLNPEIFKRMLELTGLKIHEGFGQSETVCILATTPSMEVKLGSMGKPMPIFDVKLLDAESNEVKMGEQGELCIKLKPKNIAPPGLFRGYYRNEEKTGTAMYDGFYHTGDLAYKDEDGYFWFVGRKDDIIKSSGYRIGPFEVESALLEHPAVTECAITGVPDELRGQIVKATVKLSRGYAPSDELIKELQNYVKKTTAPYKYPRTIEFVDELPKTISGKIRRIEIRENDKNKD